MMAFILATDFDFIAYMSKMDSFFGGGGGGGELFSRQWRFWNMTGILPNVKHTTYADLWW